MRRLHELLDVSLEGWKPAPRLTVPRLAIPLDHPLQERDDVRGKRAEQDLPLLGRGVPRKSDLAWLGAVLGNPAAAGGLEGVAPIDVFELLHVATDQVRIDPHHHGCLEL